MYENVCNKGTYDCQFVERLWTVWMSVLNELHLSYHCRVRIGRSSRKTAIVSRSITLGPPMSKRIEMFKIVSTPEGITGL